MHTWSVAKQKVAGHPGTAALTYLIEKERFQDLTRPHIIVGSSRPARIGAPAVWFRETAEPHDASKVPGGLSA